MRANLGLHDVEMRKSSLQRRGVRIAREIARCSRRALRNRVLESDVYLQSSSKYVIKSRCFGQIL